MIRLFVAIGIDDEDVAEALADLQREAPGARWSPRENLHVTLRFVGEVSEPVADDLDAALSGVIGAPFQLEFSGVGAFEEAGRPRAIWAGVRETEPLKVLQGRCEAAARRAGLPREPRAYRPHVTLAYLRDAPVEKVARWIQTHNLREIPPLTVRRFGLYSSRLGSDGAHYRLERAYPL